MLTPRYTSLFKKDYKRTQKRGNDIGKFRHVIELLLNKSLLPETYNDYPLREQYAGSGDCHIGPDWILIYTINGNELILYRTGSHLDLFK